LAARPQLEVRDLELVVALAAARTTQRAAGALHVTQSAVSRALGQAEDRVGVRLFERSARGLTPTAAGERLIAGARLLLVQLRELERQVASPPGAVSRLRLVCECYTAYRWLPSTIVALGQHLPGVSLQIAMQHTPDPISALVKKQIDVALLTTSSIRDAKGAGGSFAERPLFSDEVVFVVSASHPLAAIPSLTLGHLRAHSLIISSSSLAERRWFLSSIFGRRRPKLEFIVLPLTEAIIDAARAGMGVAVLSEWIANPYLGSDDLVLKRLASGPLRRPWRVAYRRELASQVESLLIALANAALELQTPHPRLVSKRSAQQSRRVRHAPRLEPADSGTRSREPSRNGSAQER
jgi:LysR family transcriptional regulator for metE and metH